MVFLGTSQFALLLEFLAMSRLRLPSVRVVLLVPWQSAFCIFLLLSTIGWMLSRGVRNDNPFPLVTVSRGFFLLPLNFFQLRAFINMESFLRFFSRVLFSTKRWAFSLLISISLFLGYLCWIIDVVYGVGVVQCIRGSFFPRKK